MDELGLHILLSRSSVHSLGPPLNSERLPTSRKADGLWEAIHL